MLTLPIGHPATRRQVVPSAVSAYPGTIDTTPQTQLAHTTAQGGEFAVPHSRGSAEQANDRTCTGGDDWATTVTGVHWVHGVYGVYGIHGVYGVYWVHRIHGVYGVYRVHRIYGVYRIHWVYRIYRVHRSDRIYRVHWTDGPALYQ
ncbi:hypothetical protein AO269_12355 [Pseudomonas putida]|nr:hypothetical protein AO269_12355 [Pseudomonas putida]